MKKELVIGLGLIVLFIFAGGVYIFISDGGDEGVVNNCDITSLGCVASEAVASSCAEIFYGTSSDLQIGDFISVEDSNGNVIGTQCISELVDTGEGIFNINVYGDDAETAVDEGAVDDEEIKFYINCQYAGNADFVNACPPEGIPLKIKQILIIQ